MLKHLAYTSLLLSCGIVVWEPQPHCHDSVTIEMTRGPPCDRACQARHNRDHGGDYLRRTNPITGGLPPKKDR